MTVLIVPPVQNRLHRKDLSSTLIPKLQEISQPHPGMALMFTAIAENGRNAVYDLLTATLYYIYFSFLLLKSDKDLRVLYLR